MTHEAPERAETTRRLFSLLTEGEGENAIRRLAPVADVMAVASESLDEIRSIAEAFRAPGRSLLMPPPDRRLNPDTILEKSYESLIRQWQALKNWTREEAVSADRYREAERRARRWQTGDAGLWDSADFDIALAWRERQNPSAAWAARYGGDFHLTMQFLDESRAARDAAIAESNRQRQESAAARRELAALRLAARTRVGLFVMSVLLVIAAVLAWMNFERTREAAHARDVAEAARAEATQQREEVRKLLADAQRNQSRFLTTKAEEALRNGNPELAALIVREALPTKMDPKRPMAVDAVSVLGEALARDPEAAVLLGHLN